MNNIILDQYLPLGINGLGLVVSVLTLVVLTVTLYYVKEYTEAATRQTDELVVQRRLSIMPSIFFNFKNLKQSLFHCSNIRISDQTEKRDFCITIESEASNLGFGPALNIAYQIKSPKFKHITYRIDRSDLLRPNGKLSLITRFNFSQSKFPKEQDIHDYLRKNLHNETPFEIVITFQDIEGNRYQQTNKVSLADYHHGVVKPA